MAAGPASPTLGVTAAPGGLGVVGLIAAVPAGDVDVWQTEVGFQELLKMSRPIKHSGFCGDLNLKKQKTCTADCRVLGNTSADRLTFLATVFQLQSKP